MNCGCTRSWAIVAVLLASPGVLAIAADPVTVSGRVVDGDRPGRNVVVWLDVADVPRPVSTHRVVLDQRNLAFVPTVLAVSVGTTVRFPNNDRVLHNVFSFRDGRRFDLGLYPVGRSRDVTFDRPGVSRVLCNIHPGMAAYVVVVDSPYHAVTDDRGVFTLPGVVPGRYSFRTWRASREPVTGVVDAGRETAWVIRWPSK